MLFPFSTVLNVMFLCPCVQVDGTAKYSVAADMAAQLNDNSTEEDVRLAKEVPGTMYVGGTDTVCPVELRYEHNYPRLTSFQLDSLCTRNILLCNGTVSRSATFCTSRDRWRS
jgi:hypothetical protein